VAAKEHTMAKVSAPQRRPSWTTSLLSFALILVITLIVAEWHSNQSTEASSSSYEYSNANPRLLLQQETVNVADKEIDDDKARDEVCKEYLMNFLNGTTDAKDECQGMLNAYQAADCADDSNTGFSVRKDRKHHNASQDDDVLIDDFYEAWECCSSIYEYYTTHCGRGPQLASYQLLAVVSVLVLCGFVKSLIRALRVEFIPDAAACIMVGAIVGGITKLINPTRT
jgi:hypothetical protein